MSLYFRYQLTGVNYPVLPLGGRFVRPRPIIPVTVVGPANSSLQMGILDTAADETVFSDNVAATIGLDLAGAPLGTATGVGTANIRVRYAEVMLRLAGTQERREWQAWVGFTAAKMAYPMLGFAGFLQFFDAHFRGDLEDVELVINSLYPGT